MTKSINSDKGGVVCFNTLENRKRFVEVFGCEDPRGFPYSVDDKTADIVLSFFDRDEVKARDSDVLWSFIMQNRKTFLLGEIHVLKKDGRRYSTIGKQVTKSIYTFIDAISLQQ